MALKRGNKWQGSVGSREGRIRVLFSSEAEATKWEEVQAARVAAGLPIERPGGGLPADAAPVGCLTTLKKHAVVEGSLPVEQLARPTHAGRAPA